MLAKVESRTTYGIKGCRVDVEVDVSGGIPGFSIVGLPDAACRESAKRVISAIRNSHFNFNSSKITVNLAPANIKKEGSCFDLAIAVGILTARGALQQEALKDIIICGELSLDGIVRPVSGVLPRAMSVEKDKTFMVPSANAAEAAMVKDCRVIPIETLNQLASFLKGEIVLSAYKEVVKKDISGHDWVMPDFCDVKGNQHAKRAIEIATAGSHNILMIGPPGEGKTMLAQRIPAILDDLSYEESLETTKIHSVAGLTKTNSFLIQQRPFRCLHHSVSDAGMLGGGTMLAPGEISLAHNGILFLDELPEFKRNILEGLRQPLEDGKIQITRVTGSVEYPAKFMLVAAMNPCPCGFLTHPTKECSCTPVQIQHYLNKISGPLLDRIDIQIEVAPLQYSQLIDKNKAESSCEIKKRVMAAKRIQKLRYESLGINSNAQLTPKYMDKFCHLTEEASRLLKLAITELSLSARAYDRIRKVARTIADMDGKELIEAVHISEAISYRSLDRKLWLE
ncbi:MAG: YifB family Mg chelatase-like AAA ATPase [Candidatus Omnitrophota bacterium]